MEFNYIWHLKITEVNILEYAIFVFVILKHVIFSPLPAEFKKATEVTEVTEVKKATEA